MLKNKFPNSIRVNILLGMELESREMYCCLCPVQLIPYAHRWQEASDLYKKLLEKDSTNPVLLWWMGADFPARYSAREALDWWSLRETTMLLLKS